MPRRRKEPDPTALAFGQAVRHYRQAQGRTLEDVAASVPAASRSTDGNRQPAAMNSKYLGELEGGWHVPSITTAKLIADALDLPLTDLVRDL